MMRPWEKKLLAMKQRAAARTVDVPEPVTLEDAVRAGQQLARDRASEELVLYGWHFLMTRYKRRGEIRWHLSAMAVPHGRLRTADDEEFLDRARAFLGAPAAPLVAAGPDAPIHWKWTESTSAAAVN